MTARLDWENDNFNEWNDVNTEYLRFEEFVVACLWRMFGFSDSFGGNCRKSFKTGVTWLVDAGCWFGVDWCSLTVVSSSSSKTADEARRGETSHKFAEVQPTVGRWIKSRSSCKYNPIISIQALRTSLDTVSTSSHKSKFLNYKETNLFLANAE